VDEESVNKSKAVSVNIINAKLKDENEPVVGNISEFSAKDKAQHMMTYRILGAIMILFILSAAAYILTDGNGSAKEVFETCKAVFPPIVTLVLGAHYVTRSKES